MDFAPLPAGNCFRHPHGIIGSLQDRAGFGEKDASGLGQPHGLHAVLEQRDAKFNFQIPDLPAQGRLRDVKSRRRACHVLFFGDGNEKASIRVGHGQPSDKVFPPKSLRGHGTEVIA